VNLDLILRLTKCEARRSIELRERETPTDVEPSTPLLYGMCVASLIANAYVGPMRENKVRLNCADCTLRIWLDRDEAKGGAMAGSFSVVDRLKPPYGVADISETGGCVDIFLGRESFSHFAAECDLSRGSIPFEIDLTLLESSRGVFPIESVHLNSRVWS